jgi:type II secretory pathway component PulF
MARISTKQLIQVCGRVGTSLHAGIDMRKVWETEANRGSPGHRRRMEEIRERVNAGEGLAEAFAASNGYFPPLACELVDVGERTGKLDEVFSRLAEHYDHVLELRRNFMIGIAWPLIELTMGIMIVGFLIWILGAIGASYGEEEPVGIFGLSGTSGLIAYMAIVGSVVGLIALAVTAVNRRWIDISPLVRLLMNVPVIGPVLQTMALARLTWSLAMATDSGIDAQKSVELAIRSAQNPYYSSGLRRIGPIIANGGEIHEAFRATKAYPEDFLNAVETGELSGRLSESMIVLSKDYERRAKAYFRVLTVMAGVAVFLIVGALMVAMIFYLFMSLYMRPINDALNGLQPQ